MFRKQVTAIAVAVAVTLGSLATGSTAQAAAPKVLNWGSNIDITVPWDPYAISDGYNRPLLLAAYEPLIRNRRNGSGFDPGLAKSWKWLSTTKLELKLDTTVKFADGSPFNATVAKQNLDRVVVKGFVGPRTTALTKVTSVAAPKPDTLVINLKSPDSNLILTLSRNMGYMVSPKALATADSKGSLPSLALATAGTGPYVLSGRESVKASKYVFTRNKAYRAAKAYPFDKIVFFVLTNPKARFNALRAGQVDIAEGSVDDRGAAERAGLKLIQQNLDVMALRLTGRDGKTVSALANVKVRQALNFAVDKDSIVDSVFKGYGTPTSQGYPKGFASWNIKWQNAYAYNPTKAKQLLAEAGASNLEFDAVVFSGDPTWSSVAAIVQANLKEVGVTMNIVPATPASFFAEIAKRDNEAFFFTYGTASVPDLVNDVYGDEGASWNPQKASDPSLLALRDKYLAATDSAKQKALAQQIGQRIVTQALDVFLYEKATFVFYNPKKVKGLGFTLGNIHPSIAGVLPAK